MRTPETRPPIWTGASAFCVTLVSLANVELGWVELKLEHSSSVSFFPRPFLSLKKLKLLILQVYPQVYAFARCNEILVNTLITELLLVEFTYLNMSSSYRRWKIIGRIDEILLYGLQLYSLCDRRQAQLHIWTCTVLMILTVRGIEMRRTIEL